MITPSLAMRVQPAASGQAPGTGASNDSGTEINFATLIGAGIAVKPGAPDLGDTRGVIKKLHAGEDDKDTTPVDPLALLDAIASGQITLDPKAAAAAAAASTAGAAAPAQAAAKPGTLTPQAKQFDDSRTAPQTGAIALHGARDTTLATKSTTNAAKATPQSDAQNPKDLPRDQQAVRDDGKLPVTTTPTAAAPAIQPQAGPVAAVKIELPERAPEIALSAATAAAASTQVMAAASPAANRNMAATVTQLEQLMQPPGTPAWNDGLANRVVWMAKNDVQTASIQLNPPNLGPVEVRVTLVSDPGSPTSATVQFSAAHSATRDAIESSMPRLHDALRESGITLGNTSVDSGNAGHARQQAESGRQSAGNGVRADLGSETFTDTGMQPRSTPLVRGGTGLVDTFA
jgi:flagellar hook-length control protein FliK